MEPGCTFLLFHHSLTLVYVHVYVYNYCSRWMLGRHWSIQFVEWWYFAVVSMIAPCQLDMSRITLCEPICSLFSMVFLACTWVLHRFSSMHRTRKLGGIFNKFHWPFTWIRVIDETHSDMLLFCHLDFWQESWRWHDIWCSHQCRCIRNLWQILPASFGAAIVSTIYYIVGSEETTPNRICFSSLLCIAIVLQVSLTHGYLPYGSSDVLVCGACSPDAAKPAPTFIELCAYVFFIMCSFHP